MKLTALALIVLLLPWTADAETLSDCAEIESAVERLDCYDGLAKQKESEAKEQKSPPAASGEPRATSGDQVPQSQPDPDAFGRKAQAPDKDIEVISAHIEKVSRSPLGHHIMTLSNGQVWMQNEPGRRRIEAGQDVTIRKHHFHYEMEFESIPDVPVRRVDVE